MDKLRVGVIGLGVGVTFVYSTVAALVPSAFPPAFRDAGGHVAVYFEAAAVITTLVLLGQVLELKARSQTSGAIRALLELAPPTARRIADDVAVFWLRDGAGRMIEAGSVEMSDAGAEQGDATLASAP